MMALLRCLLETPNNGPSPRHSGPLIADKRLCFEFLCPKRTYSTPLLLHPHRERHPLHSLGRIFLQFAQHDLDGALQLWIAALNPLGRGLLDFDVRRYTFVLDAKALL